MHFEDLREYIDEVDRLQELKKIEGVDWELELGGITELMAEQEGPALLFDRIKDYPKGYCVASNLFGNLRRTALALGLPLDIKPIDIIKGWRDKMKTFSPVSPIEVNDGPILENSMLDDDVDLLKFPVPRWHELDGGRYIGTGDLVIMKDPETGWVNVGTYRIQVHDSKTAGIFCEPGQHGRIIMEKYWKDGKKLPSSSSLRTRTSAIFSLNI